MICCGCQGHAKHRAEPARTRPTKVTRNRAPPCPAHKRPSFPSSPALTAQGNVQAQSNLGWMYANGEGVPQNYAEALKLFREAAAQGWADAQFKLGSMYEQGEGVPQNYAEALKWYRKAADQGWARAQNSLGWMYYNGWGVLQDYVQAHVWCSLAAFSHDPAIQEDDRLLGLKNRDIVARKMTQAQIAQALNLARNWKPRALQIARIEDEIAPTTVPKQNTPFRMEVPLEKEGGTFVVPVQINGAITLDFTVDSGAAEVSVPADVFSTLMRTGTIRDTDMIGEQTYVLTNLRFSGRL